MGRSGKDIVRKQRARTSKAASSAAGGGESLGLFHRPRAEKSRPWLTPLLWVAVAIAIVGTFWVIHQVLIVIPQQGMNSLRQAPQSALPTNSHCCSFMAAPTATPARTGGVLLFCNKKKLLSNWAGNTRDQPVIITQGESNRDLNYW